MHMNNQTVRTVRIEVESGGVMVEAELNDSPTADALWQALPVEGRAQLWGDEIYFPIPIDAELDAFAAETVDMGAVGYWPPGSALCLFFGPTPASHTPDEIRPASSVNVLGRISGDPSLLKRVNSGANVVVVRG